VKSIYIRDFFKKRSKHFVRSALKKYILKKRYYKKYNFLFSYFKLFIYLFTYYKKLFYIKKRRIPSTFIFSTGMHNNFISISKDKVFYFISNGLVCGRIKPKKN
jgi:hypothetical protein